MGQLTLAFTIYLSMLVPVLGWLVTRRIDRLEARVDRLPTRDEFNSLVDRVDRLEIRLGSGFDSLRSDITQIALAVGAPPSPQTG
jgi:hypothetical protein